MQKFGDRIQVLLTCVESWFLRPCPDGNWTWCLEITTCPLRTNPFEATMACEFLLLEIGCKASPES